MVNTKSTVYEIGMGTPGSPALFLKMEQEKERRKEEEGVKERRRKDDEEEDERRRKAKVEIIIGLGLEIN